MNLVGMFVPPVISANVAAEDALFLLLDLDERFSAFAAKLIFVFRLYFSALLADVVAQAEHFDGRLFELERIRNTRIAHAVRSKRLYTLFLCVCHNVSTPDFILEGFPSALTGKKSEF